MWVPGQLPGFAKGQKCEGFHKYLNAERWPPCEHKDLNLTVLFLKRTKCKSWPVAATWLQLVTSHETLDLLSFLTMIIIAWQFHIAPSSTLHTNGQVNLFVFEKVKRYSCSALLYSNCACRFQNISSVAGKKTWWRKAKLFQGAH